MKKEEKKKFGTRTHVFLTRLLVCYSARRSNFRVASLTHFKHYNLTTILITINLSTKERSYFKESLKNASASESTASMYAYVVPFPAYVSPFSIRNHPFSLLPIVPDNRKSILPTDVSHVSKLRTTYLRSVRHSPLSFIRNSHSNAIQKNAQSMSFFFLSLSLDQASISTVQTAFTAASVRPSRTHASMFASPEYRKILFIGDHSRQTVGSLLSV